jgi:hypothetical protein
VFTIVGRKREAGEDSCRTWGVDGFASGGYTRKKGGCISRQQHVLLRFGREIVGIFNRRWVTPSVELVNHADWSLLAVHTSGTTSISRSGEDVDVDIVDMPTSLEHQVPPTRATVQYCMTHHGRRS